MFRPETNTFDEHDYASFRYQYVDVDNASLSSAEATVHITVCSVNDVARGFPVSNVVANGPTAIHLVGSDADEAPGSPQSRRFARVSAFPRIGRLFQTTDGISMGALIDRTITHVPTVVVSVRHSLRARWLVERTAQATSVLQFILSP
jgi:hypothetical protein